MHVNVESAYSVYEEAHTRQSEVSVLRVRIGDEINVKGLGFRVQGFRAILELALYMSDVTVRIMLIK